jgi:DNA polymerase-1
MSRLLQVSEVERCSWDYPDTGVGRCQRILREFLTLSPLLSLHGLTSTYAGIERPLVDSVAKMIEIGVQVETNLLEEIKDSTLQQLEFLRSRIRQIVGTSLNPDDAEKVRDFLFRECGLPVITRTENGNPSSSGAVLERLVHRHPVIPYIRQYRTMRTNDSAATSLLEHVSSDSTIHANLDSLGCVTGRFTCCSPNLQGMPRVVLGAVRARPNHTLIELDISQAELRVLAHVTRDPRLVAAYTTEHADLHRRTASLILDIPECEVTTQQRDDFGKCINFAVVYGKTEYSLAEDLGVSLEQARAFIEAYFQRYPQVKCWNDYVRSKAVQELEVRTEYDRRRLLPELRSH